jgi:hypothetical protein
MISVVDAKLEIIGTLDLPGNLKQYDLVWRSWARQQFDVRILWTKEFACFDSTK